MHAFTPWSRLFASIVVMSSSACAHQGYDALKNPSHAASEQRAATGEGLGALGIIGRAQAIAPGEDATGEQLPARKRIAHSGTRIATCTTGEHVDLWLREVSPAVDGSPKLSFSVELDGEIVRPLVFEPQKGPWTRIASRLGKGEHCVTLTRNQEAQAGELDIGGAITSPGATMWAPKRRERRLWAIGDSITAGYGSRCKDAKEPFSFWSEDIEATYAARAARALDAQIEYVTSSGHGLWRNADGTMDETVPQLFARVLPSSKDTPYAPDPNSLPQAIIINLGTNDLRRPLKAAERTAFVATYVAFLGRLRTLAPDALLLVATGPMLTDAVAEPPKPLSLARQLIRQVIAQATRARLGPVEAIEFPMQTGKEGFGCQYHPNVAVHRQMASVLTETLSQLLGWEAHP